MSKRPIATDIGERILELLELFRQAHGEKPATASPLLVDLPEIANMAGASVRQARQWVKQGKLKNVSPDRRIRCNREAVEAFLNSDHKKKKP